jgi:hypothetical protein
MNETVKPGWIWTEHTRPLLGPDAPETCLARLVGFSTKGTFIKATDGTEADVCETGHTA